MTATPFASWRVQAASLAHRPWTAALLTAPPGLQLGDFTMSLAAGLLCQSPLGEDRAEACGVCQSCHWVAQGQHPDLRWVRPAALEDEEGAEEEGAAPESPEPKEKKLSREIRIDQIRELADFSQLSSHRGGVRIAVIGPVEALNTASANALLKGLEEPSEGMRYLLYGERLQGVPATVLSRCRRVTLTAPLSTVTDVRLGQAAGEGPQEWLLPLLRSGRLDALAWAERAGKAPVRPAIEWLSLWLLDLQRGLTELPPLTFSGSHEAPIRRQVQWLSAQPDAPRRLSDAQTRLQGFLAHADHPLNPRLRFESVFVSLQEVFPT
jgi:DNA polymerase-3 subunit delta'